MYQPNTFNEFFILKSFGVNFVLGYIFAVGVYTTATQLIDWFNCIYADQFHKCNSHAFGRFSS